MMFIVLAGFIFAKIFKTSENEQKFISKLLLYFINPCLVVSSFNKDFDLLRLKQLLIVILITLFVHLVLIFVASLFTITKNPVKKTYNAINRLAVVFTNCGFVGIPLINGIFGEDGVFFLMGFLVIFNIALWTYGYFQMSGSMNPKKIITNPNIIAVFLGFLIFCLPFNLPQFIARPVSMIGSMNTPVAMILIGILFADFKLPHKTEKSADLMQNELSCGEYIFMLIKTLFVRLVVSSFASLILLLFCYKLIKNIPDSKMIIFVIYICSLCPSATSVPSLSCIFEKDSSYASLLVSVSSLFCMISVPLFVALGELIIK